MLGHANAASRRSAKNGESDVWKTTWTMSLYCLNLIMTVGFRLNNVNYRDWVIDTFFTQVGAPWREVGV